MNRIACGPKLKPELASRMLWVLGLCERMCTSFVCSRRARGCPRGDKGSGWQMGIKVCDKSSGRGRKRCQLLLYRLLLLRPVGIFFLSIFQSAGKPSCCVTNDTQCVTVLCTCTHMCHRKKQALRKNRACQERHMDTKAKSKQNNAWRSRKKMLSKQTPNSKNIDPGEMLQRGSGTGDDRDVHYPWGTAIARWWRRTDVAGLLVRGLLCSYLQASTPCQRSLNKTQSFHWGKSFPITSYPNFFFHHCD